MISGMASSQSMFLVINDYYSSDLFKMLDGVVASSRINQEGEHCLAPTFDVALLLKVEGTLDDQCLKQF